MSDFFFATYIDATNFYEFIVLNSTLREFNPDQRLKPDFVY